MTAPVTALDITPAQVHDVRAQREALALRVADAVTGAFTKLATAKDDIDALWNEFEYLPKGETIMGCATKTEFCEKVLGRSIRAVQYLINGRESQAKPHEQSSPEPVSSVRLRETEDWVREYLKDGPKPMPYLPTTYLYTGNGKYGSRADQPKGVPCKDHSGHPLPCMPPVGVMTKTMAQALTNLGVQTINDGKNCGRRWHLPTTQTFHSPNGDEITLPVETERDKAIAARIMSAENETPGVARYIIEHPEIEPFRAPSQALENVNSSLQNVQNEPVELREGMLVQIEGEVYKIVGETFMLRQNRNQKQTGRYSAAMNLTKVEPTPSTPTPSKPLETDPTPLPTGVEYTADFLTKEQGEEFFKVCESLSFPRKPNPRNPNNPKYDIKRQELRYTEANTYEKRRNNDTMKDAPALNLNDAPPIIQEIRDLLSKRAGRVVNYVSLQKYGDGKGHIDWHLHAEDHNHDTPVFLVCCGETRTLSLRALPESKKWTLKDQKVFKKPMHLPTDINIPLPQGSLLVMSPEINDTYLHGVLEEKNKGVRYSINAKCLPTKDGGPRKPRVYDCHAGKKYPADAIYVGCRTKGHNGDLLREGSIFGNALRPLEYRDKRTNPAITHNDAAVFQTHALEKMKDPEFRKQVESLRGKDLLCWCKDTADFCHARVWLELANACNS